MTLLKGRASPSVGRTDLRPSLSLRVANGSLSQAMPCKRIRFDGVDDGIPIRINRKPLLRLALLAMAGGDEVRHLA